MTAIGTATTSVMLPALRPAAPADLPAVERLLTESALPTVGVAELLAERPGDFLVADDPDVPGELAGVAGLEVCCGDALLRSVAVRPAWRARGLGRELVVRLLREADERGLRSLYLLTTTAERWFPRFGFAPVERAAVPAAIAETAEFRSACPASAAVLARPCAATRDDAAHDDATRDDAPRDDATVRGA